MLEKRKSPKQIMIAAAVILLLLFLHFAGLLNPAERFVVFITKPIFSSVYRASAWIGDNYLNFRSKQLLVAENKNLQEKVSALMGEKSRCILESEENEFLKKQLHFVQANDSKFVIARVIGRNLDSAENAVIIDKGEKDGLSVGQPALVEEGVIVGKLSKVKQGSSVLLLLNDDLSRLAVKTQNQAKTAGILEGEFGLGLRMRLIPNSETINKGDIVITSGLETNVPKGLIVGAVKSVSSAPEDLFQEASIESPADYNKIGIVNIIIE